MISRNYHTNERLIQMTKLDLKEHMYGTTIVGSKGQIVIPAEARKNLSIKSGDRLLVMSKFNKALGLVKAEDLAGLIKMAMKEITDPAIKAKIKKDSKKLFTLIK